MEQMETAQIDLTGFPVKNPGGEYMFGYSGFCVDFSMRRDDPELIERCVNNGWIDHTTKMLEGQLVRKWCERVAPKCAERLASLGFPA